MPAAELSLIVLQTRDLEAARAFYSAIGLRFTGEQHGRGPFHYSCQLNGAVLELYPRQAASPPNEARDTTIVHGFSVASLDQPLDALRTLGAEVVSPPKITPWGRRARVMDPDGRTIEISEPNTTSSHEITGGR
jgi:lactoylglutathione lyase